MATAVEIKAATEGLNRSLEKIRQRMANDAELSFEQWLQGTLSIFTAQRLGGPPGVRRRTGTLARSFYTTVEGTGMERVGMIASRARYAKTLEYGTAPLPGGVIKSRRPGGALAIPIEGGPAVTAAGVYRFGAGGLRQVLPQLAPNVNFFVHKGEESAVLMGEDQATGELTSWFVLMRSVKIKPKLGLRKLVKAELKKLTKTLGKRFKATFHG